MPIKLDPKTIFAQSSDIKARTFLEYRRDMKKKAISELEIKDWLEEKLKVINPKKKVYLSKSGGDKFLWFLRKGGVSKDPDFVAKINEETIEYEFQYANDTTCDYYDFKVSKVAPKKKGVRTPIANTIFIYLHRPYKKYAFVEPKWIFEHGKIGPVPAWGNRQAFRVHKDDFEPLLVDDDKLDSVLKRINIKNEILDFQQELINQYREILLKELEGVIDENKLIQLIPKDLDSFFKVCFILDNIEKFPINADLWLIYLLSFINDRITLEQVSKITYCMDFLYAKRDPEDNETKLKENEIDKVLESLKKLIQIVDKYRQANGSYVSSNRKAPLEETRYALFFINILEDMIQDIIHYYHVSGLRPVSKIFENISDIEKTYDFITR